VLDFVLGKFTFAPIVICVSVIPSNADP